MTHHENYLDLCRRVYTRALTWRGAREPLMRAAERVVRRVMIRHPERFRRLP